MPVCKFAYVLDANLALPPNAAFISRLEDPPSVIRSVSRDGNIIHSYLGDDLGWLLHTSNVNLIDLQFPNPYNNGLSAPVARMVIQRGKQVFDGGMIQKTKYSLLEIIFQIKCVQDLTKKEFIEELKSRAERELAYFVNVYRIVSSETNVTTPFINKSIYVQISYSESDIDLNKNNIIIEFTILPTTDVNWTDPLETGYFKQLLSEHSQAILANWLSQGTPIDIYYLQLLQAKEQAQVHHNYCLSIITSAMAFESFLQLILRKLCKKYNVSNVQNRKGELINLEFALENSKPDEYLSYIISLTNYNFTSGSQHQQWKEDTVRPRNAIVHKGHLNFESTKAQAAFQAVMNYINFIHEKITIENN